jgi:hypothetical protein
VILYDSPASGNAYKARLLLAHLGTPYERRSPAVRAWLERIGPIPGHVPMDA